MSHKVAANYTMPTIVNTLKPGGKTGTAKSNATSSPTTGTSAASSSTSLGSTFLSLLATELQNQDPTAPVDSTAMVGQMISLNQLDQLISINQAITSTTTTAATGGTQPSTMPLGNTTNADGVGAIGNSLSPSAQMISMQNQLPFDPSTMMPLDPTNSATSVNSASPNVSASQLNINSNHNAAGGK